MGSKKFNAQELVAGLTESQMDGLLGALIERYWREWPITRGMFIKVKGAKGKHIADVLYPAPRLDDPEVAKGIAIAEERAKNPNTKYVEAEEFIARLERKAGIKSKAAS